jgi:hypothetical protein
MLDKTSFTGYNTRMDSIILSFELGTFPDSGIFLNIGDAGHVEPEKEGELVFFLTTTNGDPEVIISKQTAMLLYEDGFYGNNCTTVPWHDQIIYCEDALAKIYDRWEPVDEDGDDEVVHYDPPEPNWDSVSRHDSNEGW